jgi:hypothetical protein
MSLCLHVFTQSQTPERLANYIARDEQSRTSQIERDAEYGRKLFLNSSDDPRSAKKSRPWSKLVKKMG